MLGNSLVFPDVRTASPEGILAFGGDLRPERLLLAYKSGIFPWYSEGEPIIWYSPDPRMVLLPGELKISKSMQQVLRRHQWTITWDKDFEQVLAHCQKTPRKGQRGTWITREMYEAYLRLHEMGHARSVEVWDGEVLVGGLYGVDLGNVFCGESMFSAVSNSSKVAFIELVRRLESLQYRFIDCQVYNKHLASLGAREVSREDFLRLLQK